MKGLALLAALTTAAAAHPIDRFLVAAEGAELVVVVPRLEALTEPIASGLQRARLLPALAGRLGDAEALPWAFLEGDFQRKNGIDPKGSLLYAKLAVGPVLRFPVLNREAVAGLLGSFGRAVTPARVAGQEGWATDEGVALYHDGGLFGASGATLLQSFLAPGEPGALAGALARCPRGPGEADLYILARAETGRGCLTLRIDADRLVLEALADAQSLPERWVGAGDGSLLDRLGADATSVLAVHLTPAALLKAATDVRVKPLLAAFDGRVAVGMGQSLGDGTLVLGADEAVVRAELAQHGAALGLVPDGVDTWRLVQEKPIEIDGLPKIEAVFVGLRRGALVVTTQRERLDAAPARPTLAGVPEKPVLAMAHRTGGQPHDGSTLVDALAPALGKDVAAVRPWIVGVAWLAGHLGAWALSVQREGKYLRLRAEVELL